METTTATFADRLRELRKERRLSQAQLADALHISRASLSYYEKSERIPNIDVLVSFKEYFKVGFDYLLGYGDNSAPHENGESSLINPKNKPHKKTATGEKDAIRTICKIRYIGEKLIMVKGGWYCCGDCGHKLLPVSGKSVLKGVNINCKGKKGHIADKVKIISIEPKLVHDVDTLQLLLEMAHLSMNRGICCSYNICKHCREPESIIRNSATPCAEAFFRMYEDAQEKAVYSTRK